MSPARWAERRLCPQSRHAQARLSVHDRALKVAAAVESLERDMQLLCVTGVEDRLQAHVRPTLELLRNAGIKVRPPARGDRGGGMCSRASHTGRKGKAAACKTGVWAAGRDRRGAGRGCPGFWLRGRWPPGR